MLLLYYVFTAVENKIPNLSNLLEKLTVAQKRVILKRKNIDHDDDKYIATPEFNKLTAKDFATRLGKANLASTHDTSNSVKTTDFDDKLKKVNKNLSSNKTKHVLVENELQKLEDKIENLQTFDCLFIGQNYFNNDGA